MIQPFQPDLFSRTGPEWFSVPTETSRRVEALVEGISRPRLELTGPPEQSGALEINSSNLRLSTTAGRYLLKRWSDGSSESGLLRTLDLMDWLAGRSLPVPRPTKCDGAWLVERDGARWSLFEFVEGRWFTGAAGELEASAEVSGAVMAALGGLPEPLLPGPGPGHLTDADDDVLTRMSARRHRWPEMLGAEHAAQLGGCWDDVMAEWRRLRASPPAGGPVQAVHFDLHPHNLLMHERTVAAVLDFEACKVMPVGYAIGFGGVKQARQAVIARGASPATMGEVFLSRARDSYPALKGLTRFADLAATEAMRRLSLIIRLNLDEEITTWNKVLPIQLAHLKEARLLFT